MYEKQRTAENSTKSARSVSLSGKLSRGVLSAFSVRTFFAAIAALLMGGMVASTFGAAAGAAVAPHALSTSGLGYTALGSPVRIADTRTGATDPATYAGKSLAEGTSLTVDIPASAGLPANASAVVVHITAVSPSSAGYLSVYPGGAANSGTANVTFGTGQNIGNTVTVGLGTDSATSSTQSFTVYNGPATGGASVDFTADLEGYYAPQTTTSGAAFVGIAPTRVYDSRTGSGQTGAGTTLTSGGSDTVTVTGVAGVPASATAVVANIAITNATAASYISAYPAGGAPTSPVANQNFTAGETLSSQAIVGVGKGGAITVANNAGNVDIVVDIDGYFTAPGGSGSLYNVLSSPVRLLDTRTSGAIAGGASATTTLNGTGAVAGSLSIADLPTTGNYLTAYPSGTSAPLAASVNYVPADAYNVVENSSYALAGASGGVSILNGPSNAGSANIVVDESGYFGPSTAAVTTYTVTPATPQTQLVNTATSPTTPIAYTATGLGTTPVDVELFSCSGVTDTAGAYSFTPTTPTSGVAAQGPVNGYITSVNGVAEGGTPSQVNSITPVNGSITFTVNSNSIECDYPVVFAADAANTLVVNASGSPTAGYGVGGSDTYGAPNAVPGDIYDDVYVQTVNPTADTFVACYNTPAPISPTSADQCFTFSYLTSGVTNFYDYDADTTGPSDFEITEAQFASLLSGATTPFTAAATRQVDGDALYIDEGATGAPTDFEIDNDVPAAATAVTASTTAVAPSTTPFETIAWTPPVNAAAPYNDVEGYCIYAAVESATGTYSFPTGTIKGGCSAASAGGYVDNDSADTNPYTTFPSIGGPLATGTYEFEVQPYTVDGFNGPLSAPSPAVAITSTPLTPVSTESVLTHGTALVAPATAADSALVAGDTLQFVFANVTASNPLTVTAGASLTLVDKYGAEVSLTNGSNATFTVSGGGTTLTISITGKPLLISPATAGGGSDTPTELNTDIGDAVLSETGIANTTGPWNLAVSGELSDSGYPSGVTRMFDGDATSTSPTVVDSNQFFSSPVAGEEPFTALPAPIDFSNTVNAAAPNTVTITETGGTTAVPGDPITVYNAVGSVIGTGTYSSTGTTTITTTTAFSPGDELFVVYQASGSTDRHDESDSGPSNQPSHSAGVYANVGTYTFSPTPIAPQGSLGNSQTVPVTLTVDGSSGAPAPAANVWLYFDGDGSASVGGTPLTDTPQEFTTTGAGTLAISYTSSSSATSTSGASDEISAENAATPAASTLSQTDSYTYGLTVTSVDPDSGPLGGGNTVTIYGSGFVAGATVTFGSDAPVASTFVTADNLTVVVPAILPPVAGAVNVTVTNPSGQSFTDEDSYTYDPDVVSPSESTLVAVPTSVGDDGVASSTITVTLKDADGNPVAGKTVSLAEDAGAGSTISAPSGVTNAAGQATWTVADTNNEIVTYTATDATDSIVVAQTAAVTFFNPAFVSATGTGSEVTVTFNDAVCDTAAPAGSDFTVSGSVQGADVVTGVTTPLCGSGDDTTVTLTLTNPIAAGQTITVTLVATTYENAGDNPVAAPTSETYTS
jgi:hypothetical protein